MKVFVIYKMGNIKVSEEIEGLKVLDFSVL